MNLETFNIEKIDLKYGEVDVDVYKQGPIRLIGSTSIEENEVCVLKFTVYAEYWKNVLRKCYQDLELKEYASIPSLNISSKL